MNQLTAFFVRHGESTYSDIYPDLTYPGQEQARQAGEILEEATHTVPSDELHLMSSPAVRARGTAGVIADCIGYSKPLIIEPRSHIRKRFFQFLSTLIPNTAGEDTTLIAVSHFEILNHFVQLLWPRTQWFDYAHILKLQLSARTDDSHVRMQVGYNGDKRILHPQKLNTPDSNQEGGN